MRQTFTNLCYIFVKLRQLYFTIIFSNFQYQRLFEDSQLCRYQDQYAAIQSINTRTLKDVILFLTVLIKYNFIKRVIEVHCIYQFQPE